MCLDLSIRRRKQLIFLDSTALVLFE